MTNNTNLQDEYLETLCHDSIPVSVYLINGIKLSGLVSAYDADVVLLRDHKNTMNQLIYKHAISTIVPNQRTEDRGQKTE